MVKRTGGAKTPLAVPWIEPQDVAPLVVLLGPPGPRIVSGTSFAVTAGHGADVTA